MNKIIYDKLSLQADEATIQGLEKLASNINNSLLDNTEAANYDELENSFNKDMWKMATRLINYYNLENVDAKKIDQTIELWASKFLNDLEITLNVDDIIVGPNEPAVPGENK